MERTDLAKQMMDELRESFKTLWSAVVVFPDAKQDKARSVQKVYESPDELGYQLKA